MQPSTVLRPALVASFLCAHCLLHGLLSKGMKPTLDHEPNKLLLTLVPEHPGSQKLTYSSEYLMFWGLQDFVFFSFVA
jgi:hypothetical protein